MQSDEAAPTSSPSPIDVAANETATTKSSESQSSENASVEGSGSSDTMPPLVFPLDDDKILPKNDTALKILQSQSVSSKSAKSSEVIVLSRILESYAHMAHENDNLFRKYNSRGLLMTYFLDLSQLNT